MMKAKLFLCLVLLPCLTFGQLIKIQARPPYIDGKEYIFTIKKADKGIYVSYQLLSKVNPELFNNRITAAYKKTMALLNLKNIESKKVIAELKTIDSLKKPFITYATGKILLSKEKNSAYFKFLSQFLSTDTLVLKTESTNQKLLIDRGTWVYYTIVNKGSTQKIYVNTPKNDTHPLLAKLIEMTINQLPITTKIWFTN